MPTPKTVEEIITQILHQRHIKILAKNRNIELRMESILKAAKTIYNEKKN